MLYSSELLKITCQNPPVTVTVLREGERPLKTHTASLEHAGCVLCSSLPSHSLVLHISHLFGSNGPVHLFPVEQAYMLKIRRCSGACHIGSMSLFSFLSWFLSYENQYLVLQTAHVLLKGGFFLFYFTCPVSFP